MEEEETLLDIQHSPLFKLKRKGLMLTLFLFYFLCGLEYSITIPPALLDGNYSDADRTFMLTEVGLYPLAAMLTSLVLGHIYDRTKRIRTILITLAFLQIVGNLIYAIDLTKWLSLIGRFVSGLGDGFIAVSVSEITYLYEDHNRVGMLCILELGRVLGFMNGPIVNFFIVKWSTVHKWSLHKKVLPGYIMGWCWAATTIVAFCCLHNLALEVIDKFNLNDSPFLRKKTRLYNTEGDDYEDVKEIKYVHEGEESLNPFDEREELSDSDSVNSFLSPDLGEAVEEEEEEEEEKEEEEKEDEEVVKEQNGNTFEDKDIFPLPEKERKPTMREKIRSIFSTSKYKSLKEKVSDDTKEMVHKSQISQIFRIEIGLLMLMNFVLWYSHASFFMFCSYITTYEFKWGPTEIGLTYVVGFVVIVTMFVVMYFLRESLAKKNVYFVVLALAFVQISLALIIYEGIPKEMNNRMIVFIISAVLVFISVPFTLVCFRNLVTGMVRPGIQGTLQGLVSSIVRLAVIAGLLLSIVTVHGRQVYASIMTALCFLTIIFFFLSFEMITKKQKESTMKLSY